MKPKAEQLRAEAEGLEGEARGKRSQAAAIEQAEREAQLRRNAEIPVDRTKRTLTDGSPETPDHREIDPATGMQKGYVVLSAEERAKGFVRPVRSSYRHVGAPETKSVCGAVTSMGLALAETYARDPFFYSGTFCSTCRQHFPVGEDGEFVWAGTDERVGT